MELLSEMYEGLLQVVQVDELVLQIAFYEPSILQLIYPMNRRVKIIDWMKREFFRGLQGGPYVNLPCVSSRPLQKSIDDLGLYIDCTDVPGEKFSVFHQTPLIVMKCMALNSSGEPCKFFRTRDSYCGRHHRHRSIPELVHEYLNIPHPKKRLRPPNQNRCCAVGIRVNVSDSNGVCRFNATPNSNTCGYHKAHTRWNKQQRSRLKLLILERIQGYPEYIKWIIRMGSGTYIPPPPPPVQLTGGFGWNGVWDHHDEVLVTQNHVY